MASSPSRIALPGFSPAPWLPNPHLQTVWGRLARRTQLPPHIIERWDTPDGDFLDILRVAGRDDAPTFLLLHGLEGSLRSHYVAGILEAAQLRGWQANVLFFRTCGTELNRLPRSYHSGETTDVDFVARRLLALRPTSPLILAGVSLGGNVLLKWLGEQGAAIDSRIIAATAISTPFDLGRCCAHIDAGFSRIYSWNFLRSLRVKALEKIARFPGIADAEKVTAANTLWSFDDAYTSVVHGFKDAADYYARSSSLQFLADIQVPTLLLSSHDDPFMPPGLLHEVSHAVRNNPHITCEFTDRGGHVGFVEGPHPWNVTSYCERRPAEFAEGWLGMSSTQASR